MLTWSYPAASRNPRGKARLRKARSFYAESATGESGVFTQFKGFIVGVRASGIEDQDAESVAGPAIVTKIFLKAGLFHAGLFVDARDGAGGGLACGIAQARVIGLGAAQDGIDERGGRGAEIERGDGAAVIGLQERLSFERGKQQLVGAVGVVVQEFDARDERAGNQPVSDGLGANQIAPGIGAVMRGIDSAKNAVPIGVVALGAQEQIARLQQFIGGL